MKGWKRIVILGISNFLFLSFVSNYSYGQSYQSFSSELKSIRSAKFRIGPFYILPAIRFTNIGYDNNVYYQQEEDNPVSDYTGIISPEVRVYFPVHNWCLLSFSENPSYIYYLNEKERRAFSNSYSPAFKLRLFNRFVLSGDFHYRKRKSRATSEFNSPIFWQTKGYTGSIFYESERRIAFGFTARINKITYEKDLSLFEEGIQISRMLGRRERDGSFEIYYKIFSESLFFINIGSTEYLFEHPQSHMRNSTSYQIYSGIQFPILGSVRGTLSLGYKKLKPEKEEKVSFSGIVGDTSLDFRFRRFIFRLTYRRDLPFSYGERNIYFVTNTYKAGISFYLTRFLRFNYDYTYGKSGYPEPVPLTMPDGTVKEIKREDVYKLHIFGLTFRVIRNTGIGLNVNFWERESNYIGESRNKMFIGGYITYEF